METSEASLSSIETSSIAGGVKAKLALYQKECVKKKEFSNKHRPEIIGALNESMTDLSTYAGAEYTKAKQSTVSPELVNKLDEAKTDIKQYVHADMKVKQSTVPADMVNRLDDYKKDVNNYISTIEIKQSTVPADMVGRLNESYRLEFEPSEISVSDATGGMHGDSSFVFQTTAGPTHASRSKGFASPSAIKPNKVAIALTTSHLTSGPPDIALYSPQQASNSSTAVAASAATPNKLTQDRADVSKYESTAIVKESTVPADWVNPLDHARTNVKGFQSTVQVKQSTVSADEVNALDYRRTNVKGFQSTAQVKQSTVSADEVNDLDYARTNVKGFQSTAIVKQSTVSADEVNDLDEGLIREFKPFEHRHDNEHPSYSTQYANESSMTSLQHCNDQESSISSIVNHANDRQQQQDASLTMDHQHESNYNSMGSTDAHQAMKELCEFLDLEDEDFGIDSNAAATASAEISSRSNVSNNNKTIMTTEERMTHKINFATLRERYLAAIQRLCPTVMVARNEQEAADPSFQKMQKEQFRREFEKSERFAELRALWDRYEERAKDFPVEATPEDKKIEAEIQKAEEKVVSDFTCYAEQIAEVETSEEDSQEEDFLLFVEKARKMREKAERRRKKKQKAERRRKMKLEEERLMREDRELLEEAKRLRELAKKKKKKGKKI